jgi:serine protease Do
MSKPIRKTPMLAAAAILVVGAVGGAWATARVGHFPFNFSPVTAAAADQAQAQRSETGGGSVQWQEGFAPVVKKVLPAVVNISSTRVVKTSGEQIPFNDRFFRDFFGNDFPRQFNMPREQRRQGLGSGVITTPDGYILTNNHVVEGADEVKVSLHDGREFTAKVAGNDARTDLAVLKIEAKDLPVATLTDSSKVQVGDIVLAIGNPFGVGQTVTMGIVSATSRRGLGIEDYEDFIQTDAAINPGNSGGALVNAKGELVGINTAIISGGGGNQGVGFAIPINMARHVSDEIKQHGKVTRGWLGVVIQQVTPDIARSFNLPGEPRGALVGDVTSGSPAEKAGLKRGDIIVALNGSDVVDSRELRLRVADLKPGSSARLKVIRDGKDQEVNVVLGEMPADQARAGGSRSSETGPRLGISVQTLTPDLARQFGLPAGANGLVITEVQPGSTAAEAGLERGDVIRELNRKPVASADQFQQAVRSAGTEPLLLLVERDGNSRYLTVKAR